MENPLWGERPISESPQAADEKRVNRRTICEIDVRWSLFNMAPSREGVLRNYSDNGVYIELHDGLAPGTYVLVQIEKIYRIHYPKVPGECLRMNSIAEVKWCREIQAGFDQFYGAGLKYLVPI
jgi:hypothetical protein